MICFPKAIRIVDLIRKAARIPGFEPQFSGCVDRSLPIQMLPNLEYPEININTSWRNAAPQEVEASIVEPQEAALRQVPGVREIRIRSRGAFRIIYIATWPELVFALHAFRKTSAKTRKQDIELARERLRDL